MYTLLTCINLKLFQMINIFYFLPAHEMMMFIWFVSVAIRSTATRIQQHFLGAHLPPSLRTIFPQMWTTITTYHITMDTVTVHNLVAAPLTPPVLVTPIYNYIPNSPTSTRFTHTSDHPVLKQ